MMKTAMKDRVCGPVDRPVNVYGQKEYDRNGTLWFIAGIMLGIMLTILLFIILN